MANDIAMGLLPWGKKKIDINTHIHTTHAHSMHIPLKGYSRFMRRYKRTPKDHMSD
jgi:hypothetical protein